jgi:hypothetical protein
MNEPFATALRPDELDTLVDEIARYLEAVALFRREGCEPRWRREGTTTEVPK